VPQPPAYKRRGGAPLSRSLSDPRHPAPRLRLLHPPPLREPRPLPQTRCRTPRIRLSEPEREREEPRQRVRRGAARRVVDRELELGPGPRDGVAVPWDEPQPDAPTAEPRWETGW